jgi:4-hydroxybenzoate polyprenyltransferase/phosphoserine phosphatase
MPGGHTSAAALPLVVDLDGTLLATDMLHESAVGLLRASPFAALRIPFQLARGKAQLKAWLAQRFDFDPALLPLNEPFAAWLRQERARGRRMVLATASDARIARAVADHVGVFDEVLASDGATNLSGAAKARALAEHFGRGGFVYAGNSAADVAVWREAAGAVVVNAPERLAREVAALCPVEREFPSCPAGPGVYARLLRAHQWLKNLLVFVPAAAAHRLAEASLWPPLALAFCAFCLCASAVYLANDLLDLESDRRHPRKRGRALACGAVSIARAAWLSPLLLAAGLGLGLAVGGGFLVLLAGYFVLTCAYSLGLKRAALVDCLALAVLYTLRMAAGGAAVGVPISLWLLTFSVFLFLSLAFVKRYAELLAQPPGPSATLHGRGYRAGDSTLVVALGVGSGYASALVLALYLNSDAVARLYRTPGCIWATVPVLLYWVSRMWLVAHRNEMHDDPLVFAVKDKASLVAGLLFAAALAAGTLPW